jgi:predicted component of type VI protein secretion system
MPMNTTDDLSTTSLTSLLDKLTLRVDDYNTPIQRVIADVAALFNTKLPAFIESDFPRVNESILNYGMPHFYAAGSSTDEASTKIQQCMLELLANYEP